MKIRGEYVLREIAGDTLLVPVGKTALDLNGMITLDATAAEIWKGIEEQHTEEEILQRILSRFDVSETVARQDLEEFLQELRRADLLE